MSFIVGVHAYLLHPLQTDATLCCMGFDIGRESDHFGTPTGEN